MEVVNNITIVLGNNELEVQISIEQSLRGYLFQAFSEDRSKLGSGLISVNVRYQPKRHFSGFNTCICLTFVGRKMVKSSNLVCTLNSEMAISASRVLCRLLTQQFLPYSACS